MYTKLNLTNCTASSGSSSDGSSTRTTTADEPEAYFAWIEYVQSVAELADMKEKVGSAVDITKTCKHKYIFEIAKALKEKKRLKAEIAFSKVVATNNDNLATLRTHGDIGNLKEDFAKQNRKHLVAGVVVMRDAKPTTREMLRSSLLAMAENGRMLKCLALADASEVHRKFAKGTMVTGQELSR
ncbi:uncharacterized protein [Dermacentor albipictus]